MESLLPQLLPTENLFRIGLVLIFALFARLLVALFLGTLVKKLSTNSSRTRVGTLSQVASAVISTLIWITALIMILREIGFDVTPILASAGVVGVAVAFGAQTLIKDLLSGFFLLMEDQMREGETIEVAEKKGIVEKATLRAVTIRQKNGELTTVPYSAITVVTNFSRDK